ncbi:IS4 family transposase (plasmid) [Legionella geestiana]|nr:IS4 family transposase [Legionella geestiana]QBS12053.1 IS4 family transposase [Legionella geestiana]QBS12217.1 IS4 family transposase [Legionella geestiana]QBS12295.1 IS4 family transposase [Legionella geestiana]QBS12883.1 IS4 family transposase [Legionella geestiana]
MEINELSGILNGYFSWNKARMTCFACMLVSLFKVRTVNLSELACGFESEATIESRYKRIKRFFREFTICFTALAGWVMTFFDFDQTPLYLSIDRTNWQWGKQDINILMLSIAYKGIAIPLMWDLLPKRGNSNTTERIALLKRFIEQFGKERVACLLADREFVGNEWFSWLRSEGISFCIRIKSNTQTSNSLGLDVNVDALFYDLKPGEQRKLRGERRLWKQKVWLSALRLTDGELLIVATDKEVDSPIELYGRRWEIETLFSCLKSRGFNFEDTHITKPERISKLIALLSIGFCWAYKVGEWRNEQKAIKMKKHGRKEVSIFRYGLDFLRDAALNAKQNILSLIGQVMAFLSIEAPTEALI